mgnify:CR=1 FL=1
MRKKLFLYYTVLILICVIITGAFSYYLTSHFYKTEAEERMISCSLLVSRNLEELLTNNRYVDFDRLAKSYAETLNESSLNNNNQEFNKIRITFINYNGLVLGDSEADYTGMENHSEREEVKEAIQTGIGKAIRFSNTMDTDYVYIAVPIKNSQIIARLSMPLSQIKNIQNIVLGYISLGLIISICVTLIIALRFSKSILNPIEELVAKSSEISFGNYNARAEIKSHDEIAKLAESFNKMAHQLEETVSDLKDKNFKMDTILNNMTDGIIAVDKYKKIIMINSVACSLFDIVPNEFTKENLIGRNFIEVIREVQIENMLNETLSKKVILSNDFNIDHAGIKTYRIVTIPVKPLNKVQLPEQLNINIKDNGYLNSDDNSFSKFRNGAIISIQDVTNIRKLEKIRTEFVSNVTHELKTPLTSIRGFIETLRNGAIKDETVSDKFLDIIDIEAERLSMLISDILQLSEIESHTKDINITTFDIKKIVSECIEILKPEADKKDVSIKTEFNDNNLFINANKDRIKQMLINLLDNAIKYNKKGGSVLVSVFKQEGCLIIKIKDTGIGIPEEHLSRIFERFYRVDKGRSRNTGGTGLGLSIVKHIVNLYNGNINVVSKINEGTTFTIILPSVLI